MNSTETLVDPATSGQTPTAIDEAAGGHPRRWWVLAVLCLSLFLVVVDNTIVNVALPTLSADLNASTTELQWIVDAYTLVFASLLLAFGHFGDRFGRRGALALGLILFGATSALAAFATSAGGLIGVRALMGVGAALVFPATLAILMNVFTDKKQRAAAIGIWSGATGMAVAAGPVAGGFLLEHFWWGSVFLVNVPIVVVAVVAVMFVVPTSKDPDSGRMDWFGLVLSVASIGLLVWSIIEGPRLGWTSAAIVAGGLSALALLALFIWWERRVSHPLLDVGLFSNARFSAASVTIATAFFGLFGFIFMITQYMQLVLGYSPLEAGVRTVPFAVSTGICSPLSIALMHRFGSKLVVFGGLALMSIGFVMASTLSVDSSYLSNVLPSMVVMACGLGLTTSPATEAIMGALPVDKAGVGSAVNDTTRELGGTLGVAIVGSVFASLYGPQLLEELQALGLPSSATDAATGSMSAALTVASQAPAELTAGIVDAAKDAFMIGFTRGSLVAAGATALGAIVALCFLPARARDDLVTEQVAD